MEGRLLERDAELGRLAALVDDAAAGHGRAAAVLGPAGIGKTSLLDRARDRAAARGLALCAARGGELERDFPYGVVRQLFELPLRSLGERERAQALDGAAALAAPAIGLAPGDDAGASSTFAIVHGLYWLTANLAQATPLLVLVDDVHWADAGSLRFLAYLARRLEGLPVLLLVAARPPVDPERADLVDAVTGEAEVVALHPAPLSEAAVAELASGALGTAPEPELARACHEATGGNPFLCRSLVAALADADARPDGDRARLLADLGARASADAIVRRLGRLPGAATALARAVAILGTDVELRHATTLAELDERAAATAADALARQHVLRPGTPLDFVHPLVRAAVRDAVPAAERAVLHGRAARLLAQEPGGAEAAATHLLATPPAGDPSAVATLREAARAAAAKGDPEATIARLRRALHEPAGGVARVAVLAALGHAEVLAGRSDDAVAHLDEAMRSSDDAARQAAIARELSAALVIRGRYAAAATVLGRASRLEGVDPDVALALDAERRQWSAMLPSTYDAGADDPLDPDAPARTPGERVFLVSLVMEGVLRIEPAERIRGWATRAFDAGLLADRDLSVFWINAACPLIAAGGTARAAEVADAQLAAARRAGSVSDLARAHTVRAFLHRHEGDVREAEADALAAIEAGLMISLLSVAEVVEARVERGALDDAERALTDAGREGAVPENWIENFLLAARGRLRLAQGRVADAVADLEELDRRGREGWRPWNPAMFAHRSTLALALLRQGERERARVLAEEELALAHRWGTARAIGISVRTLGLAIGGDEGLRQLEASVEALARSSARLEHARSLVELGAALRRAGRRADAREPLAAGMDFAHRCGAAALSDRAREELVATGARPRRPVRTGVDALTPSELRVARMAAEGMTNREIAQALFVTLRTVQVHLGRAYQKLDIASRGELAEALVAWAPARPG